MSEHPDEGYCRLPGEVCNCLTSHAGRFVAFTAASAAVATGRSAHRQIILKPGWGRIAAGEYHRSR
jgi:hypothetical protein